MITGGCRGEGNPTSQKPKEFIAFSAFRWSGAVCGQPLPMYAYLWPCTPQKPNEFIAFLNIPGSGAAQEGIPSIPGIAIWGPGPGAWGQGPAPCGTGAWDLGPGAWGLPRKLHF